MQIRLQKKTQDYFKRDPLIVAILQKQEKIAIESILSKVDLNKIDHNGHTALYTAIVTQQFYIARLLIKHGANVDLITFSKKPIIFSAIYHFNLTTFEAILKARANLEVSNWLGCTPIFVAVKENCIAGLNLLIKAGANLNHRNRQRESIFHFALDQDSENIVEILINSKKANLNILDAFDQTPLMFAILRGFTKSAIKLIEAGANIYLTNSSGDTALSLAFNEKNKDVITALIDKKAYLLHQAYNGESTPLMRLIEMAETESALKLIKEGDTDLEMINSMETNALECALEYNNIPVLKALLEKKVNINYQKTLRRSPLTKAINLNHLEAVKLLIEAGAYINNENDEYRPLNRAFDTNNLGLLILLIDAKADINCRDVYSANYLARAIEEDKTEFAIALIDGGANLLSEECIEAFNLAKTKKNIIVMAKMLEKGFEPKGLTEVIAELDKENPSYGYACLSILKDSPCIQSSTQATVEKLLESRKPPENILALKQKTFELIDEGTNHLKPIDLAEIIGSFDNYHWRMFKPVPDFKQEQTSQKNHTLARGYR